MILLPIYIWEVMVVYMMSTPWVKNLEFFHKSKVYFVDEMENPIAEQCLYFFILCNLAFCVSCLFLSFRFDQDEELINFWKEKIKNKRIFWMMLYLCLGHLHVIILLILLLESITSLNNLENIGFMVFFVVYAASETIYRKTSFLLVIFISFFILG
jgi:hypothetical protein